MPRISIRVPGPVRVLTAVCWAAWTGGSLWAQTAPPADAYTRQIAALRSEVRAVQEDLQRLRAVLEATAQQNQALQTEIRAMRDAAATTGTASSRDGTAVARRLDALEEAVKTESRNRERDIKEVISAVARELETALQKTRGADGGRTESTSPARGQTTHTVERGDTLSVIAQAYRTTVQAIKDANKLQNDQIYPGQKLVIP
jgi:LysM repeat protein